MFSVILGNTNFSQSCIFSLTKADDSKTGHVLRDLKKSDSSFPSSEQTEGEKELHVSRSVFARDL